MAENQVNIMVGKGESSLIKDPKPSSSLSRPLWDTGVPLLHDREAYVLAEKLINTDTLYLQKLTRMLYSAVLIQTGEFDPNSPLPGWKLERLGYSPDPKLNEWEPSVNHKGYMVLANNTILFTSEAFSTTRLENDFNLRAWSRKATMSLVDLLCHNYKTWNFSNTALINSIGKAIYQNIYSIGGRSRNQGIISDIFNPRMSYEERKEKEEERKFSFLPM